MNLASGQTGTRVGLVQFLELNVNVLVSALTTQGRELY